MLKVRIRIQHYSYEAVEIGKMRHGVEADLEILANDPNEVGRMAKKVAQDFIKLDKQTDEV